MTQGRDMPVRRANSLLLIPGSASIIATSLRACRNGSGACLGADCTGSFTRNPLKDIQYLQVRNTDVRPRKTPGSSLRIWVFSLELVPASFSGEGSA